MKFYKRIFLGASLTILSTISFSHLNNVYKVYALNNIDDGDKSLEALVNTTPIYFTKDSKTYVLSNLYYEPVEIAPLDGILSNDKKNIAYALNEERFETNSYVYIYNIETGSTNKINVSIGYLFSVNSWSSDSSKLVIIQQSQYVGGMHAFILDVEKKEIIKDFYVTNNDGYWIKNNYIFADPMENCEDYCGSKGSAISIYDSVKNEIRLVYKISDKFDVIPLLDKKNNNNDYSIRFKEFDPSIQDFIKKDGKKITKEIDLDGKLVTQYLEDSWYHIDSWEEILEKYNQEKILNMNINSNKEWAMLIVNSQGNNELVMVNLKNNSSIKLLDGIQTATW